MSALPSGWELADLREVTTDISYGFTTSSILNGDGPKLLRITDIQNGNVDWRAVPHCVDAPRSFFLLQAGDIVIARTGATTGKSFLIDKLPCRTAFASYLIRARFAEGVDPRYAWSFMQSRDYWSQIQVVSKGTAQPGANAQLLSELRFPIAPLPEQRRIVAKIDSLSGKSKRARAQLDHVPRLVEKYKQAVLAAAYVDAQRRAADDVLLGGIAIEVRNGLSKKPLDDPDGHPILRISAVRPLSVRLQDIRFYPRSEAVPSTALLRNGDLLFTRYNGNPDFTAVCGQVRGLARDTAYPDKLIRVRLTKNADPNFVEIMCASPQSREWLTPHIKSAAGQHGISGADLKQLPLPLPSIPEQHIISARVGRAFAWIDRLASEAASARGLIDHLDQAVLAEAFRGELVLQDPSDEPANLLLERIRTEQQGISVVHKRDGREKSSGAILPKRRQRRRKARA